MHKYEIVLNGQHTTHDLVIAMNEEDAYIRGEKATRLDRSKFTVRKRNS